MVCARYRNALSDLAAGGPASAPLDAHLAACPQCRAELATLRQVLVVADEELALLAVAEPSGGLVPRLHAATLGSRDASARWFGLWPALAAATAVVLAITLLVIDRPAPEMAAVTETLPARAPVAAPVQQPAPDAVVAGNMEPDVQPHLHAVRSAPAEPQVLVPPGESRALFKLIALVNHEQRAPASLNGVDEPTAHLATLPSIEIQPIEIVPLDSVMNSGT